MLRVSRRPHVVVEGRNDQTAISRLAEAGGIDGEDLFVTPVQDVPRPDATRVGNWRKVELVCEEIAGTDAADRVVGLVDRDFRGFELTCGPADIVCDHHVDGRVVWSRGHSLENYWFDSDLLRKPLTMHCDCVPFIRPVLDRFAAAFDSAITLAAAAGLAAKDVGYCVPVQRILCDDGTLRAQRHGCYA